MPDAIPRTSAVVPTFLSCSVRAGDRPLVEAIRDKVLEPLGFRCLTVGLNHSAPAQVDDAVKKLLGSCHCLIGIATERLSATDRHTPDRTLSIATPYLLQETSMAFQEGLPFLILRAPGITLQGVTARNLYLEIDPSLHHGRARFKTGRDAVTSSLADLKSRAIAFGKNRSTGKLVTFLGKIATLSVGAGAVLKGVDLLRRPPCFGDFYYQDPTCKTCEYKTRCKAEKQLRSG